MSAEHIIHTLEGDVDLLDPRPEQFSLSAISRALSRIPRWCGHTPLALSVAQHSLLVSEIVARPLHYDLPEIDEKRKADLIRFPANELQLIALLHDAAEAYIGDIPTPVKHHPHVTGIRFLESLLLEQIFLKFGVRPEVASSLRLPECVKQADAAALEIERRILFGVPIHQEPIASIALREAVVSGAWFRSTVELFSLNTPDTRELFEAMVSRLSPASSEGEAGA